MGIQDERTFRRVDFETIAALHEIEDGEGLAGAYAFLVCGYLPSDRSIDRLAEMGFVKRSGDVLVLVGDGLPSPLAQGLRPVPRGTAPAPDPPARAPEDKDGEWFVTAFVSDLHRNRKARNGELDHKSVTAKFKKGLARDAEAQLGRGRDVTTLRKAVSRMALRFDEYPFLSLEEALNDVSVGKPYTLSDQQERKATREERHLGGPEHIAAIDAASVREERASRRKEGYEWLFDGGK